MIRARLRAIDAYMIMGKNTLMKAALSSIEGGDSSIDKIISQLKGNTNIIFTNGSLSDIKDILDTEVRPSPAKAGMIAPASVSIPAGPTGLDPKQTSFFQNLQIQTQIKAGQIEIKAAKQVIEEGEKIDGTQALLLDKLKIYPFSYKMHITRILQDGNLFDAAVLSLDVATIRNKFKAACKVQAQMALSAGYPTQCSVPHSLLNGFKNMVAACAESGFEFEQATKYLNAAKNAPAAGAATAGAAEAAAPVEEKKEEAEDVDMGGLFGGDDDEY